MEMSLWFYRKEPNKRRSLYLVDVHWGLGMLIVGMVILVVVLLMRRLVGMF